MQVELLYPVLVFQSDCLCGSMLILFVCHHLAAKRLPTGTNKVT